SVVEQTVGSGFYVDLRLKLAAERPATFDQEEVSPPEKWPLIIRFYPEGQGPQSESAFRVKGIPYHRSKLRQLSKSISLPVGSIPVGTIRAFQPKAGYNGPPPIPP